MTLTKGEPWYRVPARRPLFRVEVAHDVDIRQYAESRYRALGARKLVRDLEALYRQRLGHG
jgi:hypothetical protein